jgi:hypothetical protein
MKTLSSIRLAHPNWSIVLYTDDMDLRVNCASCGKRLAFGATYTSRQLFTDNGWFGLPVCTDCYAKEIKAWRE